MLPPKYINFIFLSLSRRWRLIVLPGCVVVHLTSRVRNRGCALQVTVTFQQLVIFADRDPLPSAVCRSFCLLIDSLPSSPPSASHTIPLLHDTSFSSTRPDHRGPRIRTFWPLIDHLLFVVRTPDTTHTSFRHVNRLISSAQLNSSPPATIRQLC